MSRLQKIRARRVKRQVEEAFERHPPEGIANAALFLVSDAAFSVNSLIMTVEGGWRAR